MAAIASSSASASAAGSFSIVGRNLKLNTAEDIQPILEELDAVSDLKEVHFGGNTLGVGACQALAEKLKGKKSLQIADFADIFTGRLISEIPDALRSLCDALVSHEHLIELNLSDNAFGGRSAEPMVNFLENHSTFQILKLNNNGLGVTGGTIVARALINAAEKLAKAGKQSSLRTVICGRNRLENGSASLWAEAFAKHGGLREVRMFQNGIRMEGIKAISAGLASCPDLEVLDLQDNTATLRGSRAIARALPSWPQLKVLNLNDMLLRPTGGAQIINVLSQGHNLQLETLQLQYDELTEPALKLLGPAISRHLSKLSKLEINGNYVDEDDDCISSIKDALEKHGHEDGLDELDDLEPDGEVEEDEDEDDPEDEDDDEDPDQTAFTAASHFDTSSATINADSTLDSAAEVAAQVSVSAQAVPERKEEIAQSADVGDSAEIAHKQDERRMSKADMDRLTDQLASSGL